LRERCESKENPVNGNYKRFRTSFVWPVHGLSIV
jgi:hypothetical protein